MMVNTIFNEDEVTGSEITRLDLVVGRKMLSPCHKFKTGVCIFLSFEFSKMDHIVYVRY
jgi:hypothetical protein